MHAGVSAGDERKQGSTCVWSFSVIQNSVESEDGAVAA